MTPQYSPPPDDSREAIPEPESVQEARKIIATLTKMLDNGEVEQLSCYVGLRNGEYLNLCNGNNGRHEDAGRIMEIAMLRLGFKQSQPVSEEDE